MHSWSSNLTSRTLPFSIQTIPVPAQVLWHPIICENTLTLSSALHLSTDSIQHMYTYSASQITVTHGADTIYSVFLVTHLFHLFHVLLFIIPHAISKSSTCSLPFITCYVSSLQYISSKYPSCISPVLNIKLVHPPFSLCLRSLIFPSEIKGT